MGTLTHVAPNLSIKFESLFFTFFYMFMGVFKMLVNPEMCTQMMQKYLHNHRKMQNDYKNTGKGWKQDIQ